MFRPLIKCRDVRYSGLDIRENPLVCFCTVWLFNEITGTLQIAYLIKMLLWSMGANRNVSCKGLILYFSMVVGVTVQVALMLLRDLTFLQWW
jgi:hypothetical protein